jgi:hypothetical protein
VFERAALTARVSRAAETAGEAAQCRLIEIVRHADDDATCKHSFEVTVARWRSGRPHELQETRWCVRFLGFALSNLTNFAVAFVSKRARGLSSTPNNTPPPRPLHGFDHIPATLRRLFEGKNLGKQPLKPAAAAGRRA